jgi:hypothetical protein
MQKDRFKIGIRLRHPSLDPDEISGVFALKPTLSWKAGDRAGELVHTYTVWNGLLTEGAGSEEYDEALSRAILLLENGQEWLENSFRDDGELEVTFTFYTNEDEGLLCRPRFFPELLLRLSKLNAGIGVQVWKDETEEGRSK